MRPENKLNISTAVFTAACAYAAAAAAAGAELSDRVYSTISPAIHTLLGATLFNPLSVMLSALDDNKLLFTFAFAAALSVFLLSVVSKNKSSKAFSVAVLTLLRLFANIISALLVLHVFVTASRVSLPFLSVSLLIIGINLFAARKQFHESADGFRKSPRSGSSLAVTIIIATAAAALKMSPEIFIVAAFALAIDIASSRMLKNMTPRGAVSGPARMAFMLFISSLCGIGHFWLSPPVCNERQIETGGARVAVGSDFRPYDMLLNPYSSRMYIVYKEGQVSEYDLRANALVSTVSANYRGSTQRLIYNTEKDEIYSTIWRSKDNAAVLVLKLNPMRIDRTIKIKNCPAIWLELDRRTDSLLVLCEAGDKLLWYDYNDWQLKGEAKFPRLTWPHAVKIDEARRRLYVCSGSMSRYLYEIDADTKTILRRAPIGYVNLGMAIDPAARKLYISKPIRSGVIVVDEDSLKITGFIKARPGVRDIDLDNSGSRLFAGNYINGTFQILGLPSGKILRETFVGKQIRGVYHDDNTDRNFAASACGVMELKP